MTLLLLVQSFHLPIVVKRINGFTACVMVGILLYQATNINNQHQRT
ncbi:hypothetical protein H6F71_02740 [Microcoleus sp. FACHB-61]|nr:hypothetical protein [Microcoleus sp. FACHB-61]